MREITYRHSAITPAHPAGEDRGQSTAPFPKGYADKRATYKQQFRIVYDFMNSHYPPVIGDDGGISYWEKTNADLVEADAKFKNDEYFREMLILSFEELERAFKAMLPA